MKDSALVPEERLQEIDRMAEDFATRMEEENLETTDPLYRERWIEAQEDSDLQFRLRFGKQAWLQHHIEAYHRKNAE